MIFLISQNVLVPSYAIFAECFRCVWGKQDNISFNKLFYRCPVGLSVDLSGSQSSSGRIKFNGVHIHFLLDVFVYNKKGVVIHKYSYRFIYFLYSSLTLCLMPFNVLLLGTHMPNIVMSSKELSPFIIVSYHFLYMTGTDIQVCSFWKQLYLLSFY